MMVIPVSFANMAVHPQSPDAIIDAFNALELVELDVEVADDVEEESVKDSSESDRVKLLLLLFLLFLSRFPPPFPSFLGRLWGIIDLKEKENFH